MMSYGDKLLGIRPPRISMLLLVTAFAAHWLLPAMDSWSLTARWLAATTGLAGFGMMIWAWWLFQKAETAICPTATSSVLVTSGIYRVTRNPMYLGMVLMMLAASMWFGTLPFYFVTFIYFLVIDRVFCPFEEEKLAQTFNETYLSYRGRVRRWI